MSYESTYEKPVGSDGGAYLRLTEKGQSVRIRLASGYIKFTDEIPKDDGTVKPVTRWAWVVLERQRDDKGKVTGSSAATFKAGAQVFKAICDLAKSDDWGDPQTYDIVVVRTEEKGSYYTVQPMPKPIGPISAEEKALIEEEQFDLWEMYAPGQKPEYDPFSDQ